MTSVGYLKIRKKPNTQLFLPTFRLSFWRKVFDLTPQELGNRLQLKLELRKYGCYGPSQSRMTTLHSLSPFYSLLIYTNKGEKLSSLGFRLSLSTNRSGTFPTCLFCKSKELKIRKAVGLNAFNFTAQGDFNSLRSFQHGQKT